MSRTGSWVVVRGLGGCRRQENPLTLRSRGGDFRGRLPIQRQSGRQAGRPVRCAPGHKMWGVRALCQLPTCQHVIGCRVKVRCALASTAAEGDLKYSRWSFSVDSFFCSSAKDDLRPHHQRDLAHFHGSVHRQIIRNGPQEVQVRRPEHWCQGTFFK